MGNITHQIFINNPLKYNSSLTFFNYPNSADFIVLVFTCTIKAKIIEAMMCSSFIDNRFLETCMYSARG